MSDGLGHGGRRRAAGVPDLRSDRHHQPRGAAYLRDNYRRISSAHGAGENWCIVLRVVAPPVYGHEMTELAADVTASAFSAPAAAGEPA